MVTALVIIIGISPIRIPYVSHSITPVQKMEYIPSERSLADFDFQVLIACGRNAAVVQKPAMRPTIVNPSIIGNKVI